MRVVVVPSTLALLPAYASLEDPVADLRKAVTEAVSWLVEDGQARVAQASPAAHRIGQQLLGDDEGRGPGMLVVANGAATRTERAPGHFDERAESFDAAIGAALRNGEPGSLVDIDLDLADELWAMPDAGLLRWLPSQVDSVTHAQVDYDDAPFGVQYWVVRWQCGS